MKKEYIFLIIASLSFLASFLFSRYFLQFLAVTVIFGIKWIIDSKNTKMLIMIQEAWRKGDREETEKLLNDIKTKKRIDL